jgi:uncharacterized small protein (DUF1192 family)
MASDLDKLTERLRELERSLEQSRDERGIDRMRMVESVRRVTELDRSVQAAHAEIGRVTGEVLARDAAIANLAAEVRARDASIALQQAEIERLNAILSQDGHQAIIRVGAFLAPYPRVFAVARLPFRFVRWLTRRFSR